MSMELLGLLEQWAPQLWTLLAALLGGAMGAMGALKAARMNIEAERERRREEARRDAYVALLNRLDDLDTLRTWNGMFGDYIAAGHKPSMKALERAEAYHDRVEACRRAVNAVHLYENRKEQLDAVKDSYAKVFVLLEAMETYAEKPEIGPESFTKALNAQKASYGVLLKALEGTLL